MNYSNKSFDEYIIDNVSGNHLKSGEDEKRIGRWNNTKELYTLIRFMILYVIKDFFLMTGPFLKSIFGFSLISKFLIEGFPYFCIGFVIFGFGKILFSFMGLAVKD